MTLSLNMIKRLRASHVIAVGLAVAATLWVASGAVSEKPPVARGGGDATAAKSILVRVHESHAELFERHLSLFGRSEAINTVEVRAETAGRVIARPVRKGARVDKGEVIMRLAADDRPARLKEAEAKVEYQKLAYDSARKLSQKQFQSKIKVAEQHAALETAKAALAAIRLDLARTEIRAPMAGFVETLPADVGDYVKVGDAVMSLVDLDPIRVVAQVSENQVTRLKAGDSAWVLLPGGLTRQGEIKFISKMGAAETRTFRVEVWFANADGAVPEGLTAEVRMSLGAVSAHKVSPAVLTLDERGVIGVKAVDADGKVVFHAAEIVEDATDGMWLAGLPERLTLITVGQEFVRPGEKVRALEEPVPGAAGAGKTETRS